MNSLLRLWDAAVESVTIIIIVINAIGIMVGLIEFSQAAKRIGLVIGSLVLLMMLPPILVNLYHKLSFWQQFGVLALFGIFAVAALQTRTANSRLGKTKH